MKTMFIALFTVVTLALNVQTTDSVTATFTGYAEGTFYFEDADELTHSFDAMSDAAAKQFDLTTEAFQGQMFKVTYTTTSEINEDDEEYEVLSITALELIK
ncbi:hypothetical protein JM84_1422 [Dokdonia sp. Hel_I_63]|uniref:hypothetical protein n=1 Tax=unclassified Dokdonia TaxID=2615033 RepID=UPI00020A7A60|nr:MULTISPECIES: hypothetical protein [unclassified Dokdonia]AEE18249.1 hypothetical protein Krodi_0262 [Dokdonia sp. 4H-3-7-5]TVZ22519.1 hypothetical protein JM84_1422 [Dokdonia sp. Hel_I_63]